MIIIRVILNIKDFSGPEGISNFGAISLTQIPGDPDSIKGSKARGVYWTKPDKSGKEVSRDVDIDESKKNKEKIVRMLKEAINNS